MEGIDIYSINGHIYIYYDLIYVRYDVNRTCMLKVIGIREDKARMPRKTHCSLRVVLCGRM